MAHIDLKRLGELHDERAREEERELRAALGAGYREWHKRHIVPDMNLGGVQPAPEQEEPLYVVELEWRKRLHALEVAKPNGEIDDNAVIDGNFAMLEDELQPVLKSLRAGGINIVAIHHHMTHEQPRMLFLHYWGRGPVAALTSTLKKTLAVQRSVPTPHHEHGRTR